MCGQLFIQEDLLLAYDIEHIKTLFRPDDELILTQDSALKHWNYAQWGWIHESSRQLILFARLESVATSRLFTSSYQSQRCIILASGYYEWDHSHIKQKVISKSSKIIYIAGILDPSRQRVALLTHEAQPAIAWVHHRQPMILNETQAKAYLHEPIKNLDFLRNQDLMVESKLRQASLFE